jgi:hypothetical protein
MTVQFKTYKVETSITVYRTYRIQALSEEEAEDHYPMGQLVEETPHDDETIEDITQIDDE